MNFKTEAKAPDYDISIRILDEKPSFGASDTHYFTVYIHVHFSFYHGEPLQHNAHRPALYWVLS